MGRLEQEIRLPSFGLVQIFDGQRTDTDFFWCLNTFTAPPTIYRHDIARRTSTVFLKPEVPFNPDDFETRRVFFASGDGTRIPMFVVHRKGIELDGRHPSLLYGYGGNGLSVGPWFDPLLIGLLEYGVVYAVACLRGGGEYGETWHQNGRREKKQNVFDDCIAAAEWLQGHGYASPHRSALIGASNGGLLVAAVMTQRPDLFKVALPVVGIMDMLRFQQFTMGATWAGEYGSSDDPAMFPILLAYSPLHNIKPGISYPATLVITSEHDDRVVPAHSFKFVATLQSVGAGPNPYLIRIETKSGHGPVSLPKALDERTDVYAFLLAHTVIPG
jgi:prolyl oligopeptidase